MQALVLGSIIQGSQVKECLGSNSRSFEQALLYRKFTILGVEEFVQNDAF